MLSDFISFKDLLFNKNEWTCFGQEPTVITCRPLFLLSSDSPLVSLNPMIERRRDSNVQIFRNLLVELDSGSIDEQLEYIKSMRLPYSSAVFSGNRSVHFIISLEKPLPDLQSYKFVSKWILNILTKADQATINPSKFTRVPGAERAPGKTQRLLEIKKRIQREELNEWLSLHPEQRPQVQQQQHKHYHGAFRLPKLALQWLSENDFPQGERNKRWYWIACRCRDTGYSFEESLSQLSEFYQEEPSFGRDEWTRALESAYR